MSLVLTPVDGIGEVLPDDDIAALIVDRATLRDGDVVVVTSKIVSKALGLVTTVEMSELLASQTDRVVAQRGPTKIVRTHHGLTMAAAGIDASNTASGTLLPLPPDPDASAAGIRARLRELTGLRLAVIVSDTAGRAWRIGQTDIAIGCAGLAPSESFEGRTDPYGNSLAVTTPAIADQLAGAAELASGKFGARPVVIASGVNPAWLLQDDGPGARSLIRDEAGDMFGLGSREAAVAAITGHSPVRGLPFDRTASLEDLVDLAHQEGDDVDGISITIMDDAVDISTNCECAVAAGAFSQRLSSLAIAHGHHISVAVRTVGL